MIVWTNETLDGLENAWECTGSRVLKIINTTGRKGKCFENVHLGYTRMGHKHYIFINKHKDENPEVQKECGIWVARCDYTAMGNEGFSGKTKNKVGTAIAGRFGIYEIGTVIECAGEKWILEEGRGWVREIQ